MKYLLVLLAILMIGCSDITGPDGMSVTFPATYIETELSHPQDTTWWYFSSSGTCYAAWKRKITEVSGAPPWVPHCLATDANGDCAAFRHNSKGEILGTDGRTYQEYLDFWEAKISGFLPIEYYAGTWGSKDGIILTLAVNRVVPGSYSGIACDMSNPTYVETQYAPAYVQYDLWNDDSLHGFQCDENGEPIRLLHSDPDVKFSRWHEKSLADKSNPIFKQL